MDTYYLIYTSPLLHLWVSIILFIYIRNLVSDNQNYNILFHGYPEYILDIYNFIDRLHNSIHGYL